MNETATIQTDLERLAERVERAAQVVQQLRDDRARLERERDDLAGRLQELEHKLQGQDATRLLEEVATLKQAQREWNGERKEVASRIESLLKKLERLEG